MITTSKRVMKRRLCLAKTIIGETIEITIGIITRGIECSRGSAISWRREADYSTVPLCATCPERSGSTPASP